MALYESLGFVKIEPYYENPLSGVVYWKLDLKGQQVVGADVENATGQLHRKVMEDKL